MTDPRSDHPTSDGTRSSRRQFVSALAAAGLGATVASRVATSQESEGQPIPRAIGGTSRQIDADNVGPDPHVEASRLEGADDATVPTFEYSPVVDQRGGVQTVEFEADSAMAAYADVRRPYNADGDLVVIDGSP